MAALNDEMITDDEHLMDVWGMVHWNMNDLYNMTAEPGGNPSPDEFGFGRGNYQRVISSFFSSLLPFRLLLFIRSGQYLQVFKTGKWSDSAKYSPCIIKKDNIYK